MSEHLLDAAGRRRSPATMPGFHAGRPPRNKGMRYPADPPTVEEIVAVMRAAGETTHGQRLRGLIVVLSLSGRCSASSTARRAAATGRSRPLAHSCATPRRSPASDDVSPHTSCGTLTPSSSPTKACR